MDGIGVCDRDARMLFMKLEFMSRGCSLSLDDYDRALDMVRAWSAERGVRCQQKVYESLRLHPCF